MATCVIEFVGLAGESDVAVILMGHGHAGEPMLQQFFDDVIDHADDPFFDSSVVMAARFVAWFTTWRSRCSPAWAADDIRVASSERARTHGGGDPSAAFAC